MTGKNDYKPINLYNKCWETTNAGISCTAKEVSDAYLLFI